MPIYYYSHGGDVAALAETIAKHYQMESVELKPLKPYGKMMFFLQALGQTLGRKKPPLKDYPKPQGNESMFICFPVWADNFAAPVNTFLAENDLRDRKVILASCSQSSEPQVAWKTFISECPGTKLLGMKNFTTKGNPMSVDREDVLAWIRELEV